MRRPDPPLWEEPEASKVLATCAGSTTHRARSSSSTPPAAWLPTSAGLERRGPHAATAAAREKVLTGAIARAVEAKPKNAAHGEILRLLKVEVAHGRLPAWVANTSLRRIGAIRNLFASCPDMGLSLIAHQEATLRSNLVPKE